MTILSVVEDCPTDKTRESTSFFWSTLPRKPWKISIEKYFIKNLHLLKGKSIQDCTFLKLEHFVKSLNWVWRYWLKKWAKKRFIPEIWVAKVLQSSRSQTSKSSWLRKKVLNSKSVCQLHPNFSYYVDHWNSSPMLLGKNAPSQLTLNYSKWAIETLEKGVKYVQS